MLIILLQSVSPVAMTTATFQNGRKLTLNPIDFENDFGASRFFFAFKHLYLFKL